MKRIMLVALFCLALAVSASAQAKPADLLETGWHVTVSGGYSNLSRQETNNGFLCRASVRVAKHWAARLDYFATANPKAAVIVVGPEYSFSLAHILPKSSFFDVAKLESAISAQVGAGRGSDKASPFKPAVSVGYTLGYRVSDKLIVQPLSVSYVRSAASGTQVIGNHLQFASAIGLRF